MCAAIQKHVVIQLLFYGQIPVLFKYLLVLKNLRPVYVCRYSKNMWLFKNQCYSKTLKK
jgi:hypothetical protein